MEHGTDAEKKVTPREMRENDKGHPDRMPLVCVALSEFRHEDRARHFVNIAGAMPVVNEELAPRGVSVVALRIIWASVIGAGCTQT
jgi:hypothetical protein